MADIEAMGYDIRDSLTEDEHYLTLSSQVRWEITTPDTCTTAKGRFILMFLIEKSSIYDCYCSLFAQRETIYIWKKYVSDAAEFHFFAILFVFMVDFISLFPLLVHLWVEVHFLVLAFWFIHFE